MDEAINKLCEKLGVTAVYLISELARQTIILDWIGIIFCLVLSILVTILCIVFKDKIKDLLCFNSLWALIIVIPIIIYLFTLVTVPYCILDLISWYISPVASAIKYIGNCF